MSQGRPFRPWLTFALVLLLLGWQLYVTGGAGTADAPTLMRFGARKAMFGFPQAPWRLMASCLLHAGWFHLLSNLVVLAVWGSCLERLLGRLPLLWFFALCGLWGSLLSDLYGPNVLAVGASGIVFGMILAVLAFSTLARDWPRWGGSDNALRWRDVSLAALALNLVTAAGFEFFRSGVRLDHWAHAGGAFCGLALALGPILAPGDRRTLAYWLTALLLALAAAGVIAARGSGPFS